MSTFLGMLQKLTLNELLNPVMIESKLTAWFKLNRTDVAARQYLYIDIPKHYTWIAGDPTNDPTVPRTKHWKRRVNNVGSSGIL